MDLTAQPHYRQGLALFNAGAFYESHEELEALWRVAPAEEKFFLQALIHLAVALRHRARGNADGADRQIGKCLRKLAGYLPRHGGLDTWAAYQGARALREAWRTRAPEPRPPRLEC